MIQCLGLLLLAASVVLAGLAFAQEPPAQPDDPPVRLKKKDKPEAEKPPMKDEKKDPAKKDDPKEEPEPATPQEDEAEVLNRVAKNVRLAEEKLSNKELGDGTRQLQEDILKDLDALIHSAENPPQGGGGGGGGDDDKQNPQDGSKGQSGQSKSNSGGSMGKQSGKQGSGSSQGGNSTRAQRRRQGDGSQQANKGGKQEGSGNPMAKGDETGNQQASKGGNGGDGKTMDGPNKNADLYKDVWGHLPEALRAEMNAYSNDKQFMAKYDELIKRYYRDIAGEGRKKGD